jgi:hypothetical protein
MVEGRINVWTDGAYYEPDPEGDHGDPTQLSDAGLAEVAKMHGTTLEEERALNAKAGTVPDPEWR